MSIIKQRFISLSQEYFEQVKPPLTQTKIKELIQIISKDLQDKEHTIQDLRFFIITLDSVDAIEKIISPRKLNDFQDDWFNHVLKYMIENNILEADDNLCETLTLNIKDEWERSAATLADATNDVDQKLSWSQNFFDGFTPLMAAIQRENHSLIPKLMAKTKFINYQNRFGVNPLYLALMKDDLATINLLFERTDIVVTGKNITVTIFDRLRGKGYGPLFNTLMDKLNATFEPEDYKFTEPPYFPITLLNEKKQQQLQVKLLEKIDSMPFFQKHRGVKDDLIEFIISDDSDDPLPFKKLNRLAIAFETVCYLLHPEWIKQSEASLCGPASVMQQLAINQPEKFVYSIIEIANLENKQEKKCLPNIVKTIPQDTKDNSFSVLDLWMEVIKHNYNVMTGYYRPKYEPLTGLTTPYQLEKMFEDFDYQVKSENMQVSLSTQSKLGKVADQFRKHMLASYVALPEPFKIYSKKHKEQSNNLERFNSLNAWFLEHPKGVMMTIHLSAQLVANLINAYYVNRPSLLLIENSHYGNLQNFEYDSSTDTVSFNLLTWGFDFRVENFDAKEFRRGFLGGVMAEPKPEHTPSKVRRP